VPIKRRSSRDVTEASFWQVEATSKKEGVTRTRGVALSSKETWKVRLMLEEQVENLQPSA
jgi:hypothetical protein